MIDVNEISQQMSDLDEAALLKSLAQVEGQADAALAALEACQKGLELVGQRFEAQEYFLSDLIYAGELMTDAAALLKPALADSASSSALGKLVICTVKGDLHDIGKNIVVIMMDAAGFEVIDLGVDISPEAIVQAVRDSGAQIVGLSSVLTLAVDSMKATVDAFVAAGLRDQVKIIIGGNPVSEAVCEYVGADAWAHNPQDGIKTCKQWLD